MESKVWIAGRGEGMGVNLESAVTVASWSLAAPFLYLWCGSEKHVERWKECR